MFGFQSGKYHQVHSEEPSSTIDEKAIERDPPLNWKATAFFLILGAALSAGVLSLIDTNHCPATRLKAMTTKPCGDSAAEARAAGCIFDPMMNSWLSEDCYDEELSREFRGLRDWTFYTDENRTRQLTAEEFSEAGDSWGTWEYHISHCMYAVRKLQRAILTGRKIERIVSIEAHTAHCANVANVTFTLMEEAHSRGEHFSMQDMGTVLHTGYPLCIESINLLPFSGVVI